MLHSDWISHLTNHSSTRAIGAKIGTSHTTIGRQVAAENLSPGIVIALCRAYGRSPVDGLVETGYIHPHEVETGPIAAVLPSATNKQLLDEIMRRSDPESHTLFTANVYDMPTGAAADSSPDEDWDPFPDDNHIP
ncbi:hypothetical protein [Corynebacterium bovis]|uniref:hypothetical protein n=1 Tax=Corynebacterium bovis TaxID=36808 RepID=UPI003139DCD8